MTTKFNTQDAPSMKNATFFCTINGQRMAMFNAKEFTAKATVKNDDVPALGQIITGKKVSGLAIKLDFTMYKCTEAFDNLIIDYKNTGFLPTFECQVTSEDKATCMGRATKIYRNCVLDGDILLSAFNADGGFIEQQISAYALDFDAPEQYKTPDYMM